jgi:uncharacterized protein
MRRTFFARYALLILCVVCFLGPLALRGARMSMQRMTNRVKDWLPSDYLETAELEWFGRHFMGEQFIIVTWPGCSEDDPGYRQLVERIGQELAPAEALGEEVPAAALPRKPFASLTAEERSALDRRRAGDLADQLGLMPTGDYQENWGARGEKWLHGDHDLWYFITPEGQLYRWTGRSNMLNWLHRAFRQRFLGQAQAEGELVATFGQPPTADGPNEFHAHPERLAARLFKSITTGPDTLAQLSRKDGPLWPLGVDDEYASEEAQQKALARLTESLFALSTFTPTLRFGYLMLTILFAGMFAELIMLPALLAGPLGRFCDPRRSRQAGPVPAGNSPSRISRRMPVCLAMASCDGVTAGTFPAAAEERGQWRFVEDFEERKV